jgi:hypothetical protein
MPAGSTVSVPARLIEKFSPIPCRIHCIRASSADSGAQPNPCRIHCIRASLADSGPQPNSLLDPLYPCSAEPSGAQANQWSTAESVGA